MYSVYMTDDKTQTFTAFDLETTGLNPDEDSIIEIGILKFSYDNKGNLIKKDSYSQLINPQKKLPIKAQLITGIKPEDLKNQPTIEEVLTDIKKFFQNADFVLGHNVAFDVSFLGKKVKIDAPAIDSQFFTETFFPGLPSYSLDVIPFELGIKRGDAHRALDDTIASAQIFLASLKQFVSMKNVNKDIIGLFQKAGLNETPVLKQALKRLEPNEEIFIPKPTSYEKAETLPEVKDCVEKKLREGGKQIITHTAVSGVPESAWATNKAYPNSTLLAVKNKLSAINISDGKFIGNLGRIVCNQLLSGMVERNEITGAEAILAAKLLSAYEINETFCYWPRLSKQESLHLPEVLSDFKQCSKHECKTFIKITSSILKNQGFMATTHFDLWSLPEKFLPQDLSLVITDFDDAIDTLGKRLEKKVNLETLPELLDAIPKKDMQKQLTLSFHKNDKSDKSINLDKQIKEVKTKNDLLWGLININYLDLISTHPRAHITPEIQKAVEFKKIVSAAEKLVDTINGLIKVLQKSKDEYQKAYCSPLKQIKDAFKTLINPKGYHLYLEKFNEQVSLKLIPSFLTVSSEFQKRVAPKTLLIGATGAEMVTTHYIEMLDIHNWPTTFLDIKPERKASLVLAESPEPDIELALRILIANEFEKAIVVAKNYREADLYAQHLNEALDGSKKIISAANSVSKSMYGFAQEQNAILITSPRGRILNLPWPKIDLAIISSIPFPMPEPHAGFMQSTFPKAILAHKVLLSKILKNRGSDIKLFLLDGRLVEKDYGKNFIKLAEELCGSKIEKLNIK